MTDPNASPPPYYQVPPPTADPEAVGPGAQRVYLGWVLLAIVFAYLMAGAILGSYARGAKAGHDFSQSELALKEALSAKTLLQSLPSSLAGGSNRDLDTVADQVEPYRRTDPEAAGIDAAIRYEEGKPVMPADLQKLASGTPAQRALAQIYGAKTLTRAQAQSLAARLSEGSLLDQIATAHAFEKAGDPSLRAKLAPGWKVGVLLVFTLGAVVLFMLGVVLWFVFGTMRLAGSLVPLGHPMQPLSLARADRAAVRAVTLIVGFFVLSLVVQNFAAPLGLDEGVVAITVAALMIAFVVLLFRTTVFGQRIALRDVGVSRQDLGRNVLLGVTGFVANIPLLAIAVLIGNALTSVVPQPHHPATDMLFKNPSTLTIVGLLIEASVMAPFWEEIMFRGLLFPAFSRVTGSVVVGGLISSFLFASIHPQGIALWFGIGSIAITSCVLSYHTKSLVPSIVMHATHNTVILAMTILVLR